MTLTSTLVHFILHSPLIIIRIAVTFQHNVPQSSNLSSNEDGLGEEFTASIVCILNSRTGDVSDIELNEAGLNLALTTARLLYPQLRFNLRHVNASSRCTANHVGAAAAEAYYRSNVTAFVGPACSYALEPVARLASTWNIPVYTTGGIGITFNDKNDFTTLTRLASNLESVSEFVNDIMHRFNWHHVILMYDRTWTFGELLGRATQRRLRSTSQFQIDLSVYDFDGSSADLNIPRMLSEGSTKARVFIVSAHGDRVREIMLAAADLGMDRSQYVFLTADLFEYPRSFGNYTWFRVNDTRNQDARRMWESLMIISLLTPDPSLDEHEEFAYNVSRITNEKYKTALRPEEVNFWISGLHDCVLLYAFALNETLAEGGDPRNGKLIAQRMWNRTFTGGVHGNAYINANGDRVLDYTLRDMNPETGRMMAVANFYGATNRYELHPGASIHWPGRNSPPPDVPYCGFTGNDPKCTESFSSKAVITIPVTISILLATLAVLYVYRRFHLEKTLNDKWWLIKLEDLTLERSPYPFFSSKSSLTATTQRNTDKVVDMIPKPVSDAPVADGCCGVYQGAKVAVKFLEMNKPVADRNLLLELKQMRDSQHENLARFIGACIEENQFIIVTEYCSRGSLEDLLANDDVKMEILVRYSIMNDIVEAMHYIHTCPISIHGRLRSSTCMIDGRFSVKLTDFGLRSIRTRVAPSSNPSALLWTSPELLRTDIPENEGSHEGDVYSFAIILQEIITRQTPFGYAECTEENIDAQGVIDRVKAKTNPPYRPTFCRKHCSAELYSIMCHCWHENPHARPTFSSIRERMRKITKTKGGGNLLDNLLRRMEQYANNLEAIVNERTSALIEEKRKSEELLYQVLPKSVAERLKHGRQVEPESFECVTIYFSDIVGFTNLSAVSTPIQVVDLLNDLYTCFDAIIAGFDVYKVETIGDAYMVVSGLPVRNGSRHASEIARMSLTILDTIRKFRIRHMPSERLMLRIGLHSGPCAAGVVGLKMPRYCLFGDTVNTASRMESSGEALKIHTSSATKEILDTIGTFVTEPRGDVDIKGKGIMETYWLIGENEDHGPLALISKMF